jgi:DNA-binding MarR family transcriptional regulator
MATNPDARMMVCTCRALSQATRRVHRLYDAALAPVGLTIGQFGLLTQIRFVPDQTLMELAERNVMDPSTVSRLLRPLTARRLVETHVDRNDRRARRVRLTHEGAKLQAEAVPNWQAAQSQLEQAIGKGPNTELRALLGNVITTLQD